MILPNFNLTPGTTVANIFITQDIFTFYDAIRAVHTLPYGRIENPVEFATIIMEGKGTCSTKHATLKALAEEHAIYGLKLEMAIYAMNRENTEGIGGLLKKYNLPYILEAHIYLRYDDEIYDYTFHNTREMPWRDAVLVESTIDTDQIVNFKKEYHRAVLNDWIVRDNLPYSLDELWSIREECIKALEQITAT